MGTHSGEWPCRPSPADHLGDHREHKASALRFQRPWAATVDTQHWTPSAPLQVLVVFETLRFLWLAHLKKEIQISGVYCHVLMFPGLNQ